MMGEPGSYYDWKARFKHKREHRKMKRINSLGIYVHEFGEFLEDWKKKNLPMNGKSRKILF
ncbi:MAG: hypothetical protein ACFE94_15195 [Candidatus Hodarchaeota archaeon]